MTIVGHTLTGFSFATLVVGPTTPRRRQVLLAFVFGGLANIPDMPLPYWGHACYAVSHSLFVNAGLIGLVGLVFWSLRGRLQRVGTWRIQGWAAAAWLSHLLLDSFYNHGQGVAIYWPVSDGRLALPLPWFATLTFPWDRAHNLRVFGVELAFYGALFVGSVFARRMWGNVRA